MMRGTRQPVSKKARLNTVYIKIGQIYIPIGTCLPGERRQARTSVSLALEHNGRNFHSNAITYHVPGGHES
jgi:hypothetical protein